jgi:hypothetical protein
MALTGGSGDGRRRCGASPGKSPTPIDLTRRGELYGASAAQKWSPELARRRGRTAADTGTRSEDATGDDLLQ